MISTSSSEQVEKNSFLYNFLLINCKRFGNSGIKIVRQIKRVANYNATSAITAYYHSIH